MISKKVNMQHSSNPVLLRYPKIEVQYVYYFDSLAACIRCGYDTQCKLAMNFTSKFNTQIVKKFEF